MTGLPSEALLETRLPLAGRRQGKVRDVYDLTLADGSAGALIVATDRVSAFDVVMANGMPGKGIVLTQISRFWFEHFADRVRHHLVSTDVADIPGISEAERELLRGRVMLCRKVEVVPIECVARGFLAGSGWKDYRATGAVCGIALPAGLRNGDRLEQPIFTPATKAETGHDENISFEAACEAVGTDLMVRLRDLTLSLYGEARAYAAERGILLADTKFEFGRLPGVPEPLLIDEIFTPDSSRFWPADAWTPGGEQPSFDKQYVRDWLEGLVAAGTWDKTAPGPALPEPVIDATMARYLEAYRRLTGAELEL
ncbi:MAG TPA: phosphoribosylaminoimidazolesuccinocarboxamide synthase [Pseudomonadales bacterium]|nr:phosphoribosylaminoimidazolesuccinocarboxamide synthase [Pseudomonadales bacterium]